MLDRFGEDANIHKNSPSKFDLNANSAVNDGLVSWIIQFGGKIQVTSPNELKNMVLKRAEEIKSAYTIDCCANLQKTNNIFRPLSIAILEKNLSLL